MAKTRSRILVMLPLLEPPIGQVTHNGIARGDAMFSAEVMLEMLKEEDKSSL